MLVTQITKNIPNQEYLYNAYEEDLDGVYNYERSFSEVDKIFNDLTDQLNNKYTHILVMSMGWNNDQVESLWRYKKILKNLSSVADEKKEIFKPLVIAFTWPSAWATISDSWLKRKIGHIFSLSLIHI